MSKRKKSSDKHASQARSGIYIPSDPHLRKLTGVVLIVIAGCIAYFPSISGGFILDDDKLVADNPIVRASDGLYRFWCTTKTIDYWPVTNTSFWFEWRLWGMNPTGYHVTNLILHIVEALLIWIILRKLSIPGAFWAAMIFAVHPVNVESVAWISQRKNTMAMLFLLLSILCYLKSEAPPPGTSAGAKRGNTTLLQSINVWYWLSLAAFVLGMLSKGSVAVLPVLLLGIVWWLRPLTWRDLARAAPFFVVAVTLAGVSVWFQKHGEEIVLRSAGYMERILGAGCVVWFYLYKACLPINLAFVYPQWEIQVGNPLWWLPLLAAIVITAMLWRYRNSRGRPLLFAWGFFCVSLVPAMGFIDVGFMKYSLVADHYQHIALIGVIALASSGISAWHRRVRDGECWPATLIAVAAVIILAFLTWRQSGIYRDAVTLYQATLKKNPEFSLGHYNLGKILFDKDRLQEAIEHYEQALALKPDYAEAHNNLGVALVQAGRPREAIEHNEQALRMHPDSHESHYNLGNAFKAAGQTQRAIEQYEQALALKPDYIAAHNNLGVTLVQEGRPQEAIEHYHQALKFKEDDSDTHYNLGNALVQTGQFQEAIEHYQQALRLNPNYAEAYNNLGVLLFQMGRAQEAIKYYQQAMQIKPDYVHACNNMALAYASMRRSSEAVTAAQKALELARSQGQTAMVRQIEDWLNSYQRQTTTDVAPGGDGAREQQRMRNAE